MKFELQKLLKLEPGTEAVVASFAVVEAASFFEGVVPSLVVDVVATFVEGLERALLSGCFDLRMQEARR